MTNPISANDTQALVSKAVREKGLPAVCQITGLHRESLTRALAGLPVRRGTALLIREALAPKPAALVKRLYQIPAAALVTRQLASAHRTNSNAHGDKP